MVKDTLVCLDLVWSSMGRVAGLSRPGSVFCSVDMELNYQLYFPFWLVGVKI
jgi:hypothetical protein